MIDYFITLKLFARQFEETHARSCKVLVSGPHTSPELHKVTVTLKLSDPVFRLEEIRKPEQFTDPRAAVAECCEAIIYRLWSQSLIPSPIEQAAHEAAVAAAEGKMQCGTCGEWFDPGNLTSVMVHEHNPNINPANSIGIHGKKVE